MTTLVIVIKTEFMVACVTRRNWEAMHPKVWERTQGLNTYMHAYIHTYTHIIK